MLALDQEISPGVYADHVDPNLCHIVPDRLQLAQVDGRPDFQLVLFRSLAATNGGQLTARFKPRHQLAGPNSPATSRQQRIALRTVADDLDVLLDWHPVFADRSGSFLFRHTMTATQASLATSLATNGSNLLELTLLEDRPAMRGPQPWRVTGDITTVHDALGAQLGDAPVSQKVLEMAVRGLTDDHLRWITLGAANDNPDPAAWAALISRIAAEFCDHVAGENYILKPVLADGPLDLRLDRPWAELLHTRLTWGFEQHPDLTAADTFDHHFPQIDQSDPFRNADINIIHHLPLDALSAQSLHVDLAFTGSTGTPVHDSFVFKSEDDASVRKEIIRGELVHDFAVKTRARVLLPPSGGQGFPLFWPRDAAFVSNGNSLTAAITSAQLDVQLRSLEATSEVFGIAEAIHVSLQSDIYNTRITLDAQTPSAWVTLPGQHSDYITTIEAARDGNVQTIVPRLAHNDVTVLPIDLVPFDPMSITITLADTDIVFAIVEWQDAKSTTNLQSAIVTPDNIPVLRHWPTTIFDTLSLRWRARVVRRDANGNTTPITKGTWVETTVPHFELTRLS